MVPERDASNDQKNRHKSSRGPNEVLQRFSLEPARPGCEGRPFASPLFRRMAGRGAFFRGFPVRWGLHIALSLIRSVSLHVIEACSEENLPDECNRPCGDATSLFFTALWQQQSRSI